MKVPETISEISLEWIRESIPFENHACKPIDMEIVSGFGAWSLLGRLARVKLLYESDGCRPASVIVKFQGQHAFREREGQIYRLLEEAGVAGVPRLYNRFDNDGTTLILEDMKPARPRTFAEGCSIEEAEQVISTLADIHGQFWNDNRIPVSPPEQFAGVIEYNMQQCWDIFKNRYADRLDDTVDDFKWMGSNALPVSRCHNARPQTLSHGDLHLENILFTDDPDSRPVLIDWQLSGLKNAAFDAAFFLVQSLTPVQRRENEDRLCRVYHDHLPGRAREEYPYRRFQLDYRACVTRSMVSAVMLLGPRFKDRPNQMEYADILAERVIAAVKDLKPVNAVRELGSANC